MENQHLKDFEPLPQEGIQDGFIVKSLMAYNNILVLLIEAEKKGNVPAILANVERLKSMVKYYLKNAEMLNARIKYYQSVNQSLEAENQRLLNENLLLVMENKGREPYLRAKKMLDEFFNEP